ncbi:hypothetical protein E2C01_042952 [Portunus trituberculatus]|uniref:Uncharacterized protein n=1 Tax=Portunus trituberculatus TaxID=210409 RepID=A0A5B7FUS5_PORTR|nr:hypothetical protein [Portunus trituberculatus]
MEETLGRLSLILSSSQGSPFSGFQSLASQVDNSQPGTSRAMQKPGQAEPTGATSPEVEMVPASTAVLPQFLAQGLVCAPQLPCLAAMPFLAVVWTMWTLVSLCRAAFHFFKRLLLRQ